jgi:hypothetical protein
MNAQDRGRVVPYIVLADTRRAALADYIAARVERWRAHWAGEAKSPVHAEILDGLEATRDSRLSDAACFSASGGASTPLVVAVPRRCLAQVAGVLGDAADSGIYDRHQGMAEQLEFEAVRALAREFRTPDALELSVERVKEPSPGVIRELIAQRYVTALVTLGEARCPFALLLSPELLSAALPAAGSRAPQERLERRKMAVTAETVSVEAILGTAEVSVGELAGLCEGDVIVLDQKLGEAGALSIRGGESIVAATPGKVDAMRAVQIRGTGK